MNEINNTINQFLKRNSVTELRILGWSMFHIKEVRFVLIGERNELQLVANYCTFFSGDLMKWSNPVLELRTDKQLLIPERGIYEDVLCIFDRKNDFQLRCKNIYLDDGESKSEDSVNLDLPIVHLTEFNRNLERLPNLRVIMGNSSKSKITLILKEDVIVDFLNPESVRTKSKEKIIECNNPKYFHGSLLNNQKAIFELRIENDEYILKSADGSYKVIAESFEFKDIDLLL